MSDREANDLWFGSPLFEQEASLVRPPESGPTREATIGDTELSPVPARRRLAAERLRALPSPECDRPGGRELGEFYPPPGQEETS